MDTPDTKTVTSIQFSILSPDDIRGNSVVEITKHDTYDKDEPIIKGLFDPRMGVTEMGKVCKTCGQKNIDCPGHFGHIELARPVYNYHFLPYLMKILRCVCFKCSKLLVDKNDIIVQTTLKKSPKYRFTEINKMCQRINRCGQERPDGCGCIQPDKYKLDGLNGIKAIFKNIDSENPEHNLSVEYIRSILEKISDEDVSFLGLTSSWCRPEWMICSVLPVPPPSMRPSVKQDNSQRMDDDLSHKLSDIIKCNNSLLQKVNTDTKHDIIDDLTKVLQYHIATFVDNEIPHISPAVHRSGRPLKSLRQRLKGKDGRIRNNLMGKRVDYSARSVITPDPNIELDELGVPLKIAMNLTYPEKVTIYNIDKLYEYVKNGPENYPGVKTIIKKDDGIKKSINELNKDSIILKIGDTVNRHLINGDYVLFNRQPSLHKMSMMGHRVRVMKGNTFRLNISVTPPYNADFDGDEMNMHAPQSSETRRELKDIMSVTKHIISPRENKPIITIVQDTLLGIYKLTNSYNVNYIASKSKNLYMENTNIIPVKGSPSGLNNSVIECSVFTKKQFMNIITSLSTFDGTIPKPKYSYKYKDNKVELWTGNQVLSYILPKNINLTHKNYSWSENNPNDDIINIVKIVNGSIKQGTFDKGLFTQTSKGLIHTIYNDNKSDGPRLAKNLIDDLQKIVTYFLLIEGFSIGISDMIADKSTLDKINTKIYQRKNEIDSIIQELHFNIFENLTGLSNKDYFEMKINNILNTTLRETGTMGLNNLDQKNRATHMVKSKSKGNPNNISQMVACLGQQNVDAKRIPYGYEDRTLPHYYKYDDSAEGRGFVENSFISGQTPQEFFFHAMGGREGLIDTAVKTAETGYVQRKIMKVLEDLCVSFDYSVRTSNGTIIQFIYGNDGMDAIYIEEQLLPIINMSTDTICKNYMFNNSEDISQYVDVQVNKTTMNNDMKVIIQTLIDHKNYLIKKIFNYNGTTVTKTKINYPVHIQRIVSNICKKTESKSNISPHEIYKESNKLKDELYVNKNNKNNKILQILIDIHLNPVILIKNYIIQKDEFYSIIDLIRYQFNKSRINPGEMVGALAAQSIGEPATQMTLNTFHSAGISAKSNVTRGIARLRELLHITKNLKSPSVKIYLSEDNSKDINKCNFIKNELEQTKLYDIIKSCDIHYDPNNNRFQSIVDDDNIFLSIYKEFLEETYTENYNVSPWIIRFVFDKEKLLDTGILMEDVYIAITNYDPQKIKFIYSDESSKQIIGRVSIINDDNGIEYDGVYDQSDIISRFRNIQEDMINNVVIKGINNISNIVISDSDTPQIIYEKGEIKVIPEKILETDGTNLIDILDNKYVDNTRTSSNDIIEIYQLLGIEAARSKLIYEITDVIKDAGEDVNNRHIELLCDMMTSTGKLLSINRQGIKVGNIGPLAKCSFEDTTDQLIQAGIFGELDKLMGVSSNVMMGQKIKSGTNSSTLFLDEEKLLQELENININTDPITSVTDKNIDILMDDDDDDYYCDDEAFKMSIE
uniref:DNA-directed RNA polymerase II subunit RPB1 n=1 Tax=viral metagenome TaxID=1070528 RepID=A0A6C0D0H6_9ZZZZ